MSTRCTDIQRRNLNPLSLQTSTATVELIQQISTSTPGKTVRHSHNSNMLLHMLRTYTTLTLSVKITTLSMIVSITRITVPTTTASDLALIHQFESAALSLPKSDYEKMHLFRDRGETRPETISTSLSPDECNSTIQNRAQQTISALISRSHCSATICRTILS